MASLNIVNAERKRFRVQAVEVTEENMHDVAKWCGGEVRESDLSEEGGLEGQQFYIKVEVKKPLNDKQTRAYVGDWVLLAGDGPPGFKVYTPRAFTGSFDILVSHMAETVQRMDERAAREEAAEAEDDDVSFEDLAGVRRSGTVDPLRPFNQPV